MSKTTNAAKLICLNDYLAFREKEKKDSGYLSTLIAEKNEKSLNKHNTTVGNYPITHKYAYKSL